MLVFRRLRPVSIRPRSDWGVFAGLTALLASNLLTMTATFPGMGLDLTPVGFILTGIAVAYAQLRDRLGDRIRVARHKTFKGMTDAVMVIDLDGRIIDMNPAAEKMTEATLQAARGKKAAEVFSMWREIGKKMTGQAEARIAFELNKGEKRLMEMTLTLVRDPGGRPGGKLAVFHDVTYVKKMEEDLLKCNRELLLKNEEMNVLQEQLQQRAIRDPLTGLYNRRFLEETLGQELAHAQRNHEPMSVVMIDIDCFKQLNETYGHNLGDMFLIALGDILERKIRYGDVACRFGGEEFIVVMPGAPLEAAAERADELRRYFNVLNVGVSGQPVKATFSAGVAGFPLHGTDEKTIIAEADRALYAAKEAGRNRVFVARQEQH